MKLKSSLLTAALVFFTISGSSIYAQEKSDISNLIAQASAKSVMRDELSDFTFRLSFSIRESSKGRDKMSSMVYESFTPSRFPLKNVRLPMILIEKDGILLDENKLEAQRTKLVKQIESIEREAVKKPNRTVSFQPADNYPKAIFEVDSIFRADKAWEVDVMQILQGSDFSNPRNVVLNGRNAVLLDFQARPNFAFTNKMQYFTKLKGNIWIDTIDKKVVRVVGLTNAAAITTSEATAKNSVVTYELTKVAENLWALSSAELKTIDFPNIFGKAGMDFKMEFADYKRFRSEVNDSTVISPQN